MEREIEAPFLPPEDMFIQEEDIQDSLEDNIPAV